MNELTSKFKYCIKKDSKWKLFSINNLSLKTLRIRKHSLIHTLTDLFLLMNDNIKLNRSSQITIIINKEKYTFVFYFRNLYLKQCSPCHGSWWSEISNINKFWTGKNFRTKFSVQQLRTSKVLRWKELFYKPANGEWILAL